MNEISLQKLNQNLNIDTNSFLVVSVSGGVDSMTLLDVLRKSNSNLCAVFFDHQTRPSINEELMMVKKYCFQHNILFYNFTLEINNTKNFHNEARKLRYKHLKNIADKHSTPYILTGHQLNDLVESYLMRKKENSYRFNMSIINEQNNYTLVKPFLLTKKEILYEYAKLNNVPFMEDESNKETFYFRNKVRKEAEHLINSNDEVVTNLIINFKLEKEKELLLIKEANNYLTSNQNIDVNHFLSLNNDLQKMIVTMQLKNYQITPKQRLVNNIINLYQNNHGSNYIYLSEDLLYYKAYDKTFIINNKDSNFVNIVLNEGLNVINDSLSFTFFTDINHSSESHDILCYNKLVFPLVARNRLPGDILSFKYGRKKLKSYLIDKKVPAYLRDNLIIICDQAGLIVLILNLYKNECLGSGNKLYYQITRSK